MWVTCMQVQLKLGKWALDGKEIISYPNTYLNTLKMYIFKMEDRSEKNLTYQVRDHIIKKVSQSINHQSIMTDY